MRGPNTYFKKSDVQRALKLLEEAGVPFRGIVFEPGKFTVLTGEPATNGDERNEWDADLGTDQAQAR